MNRREFFKTGTGAFFIATAMKVPGVEIDWVCDIKAAMAGKLDFRQIRVDAERILNQ